MKMQLHSAMILASVLAVSTTAFAAETTPQSTETTTKMENVAPNLPEKKAGESDVDEVITNRKLRAETGSKSKYSFSTTLQYLGGTVKSPGSEERPNIASVTYVADKPQLGGSIGAKYKISALQSLSADVGVLIYKPFHTDSKKNFRERTTVADPGITYQVVYQAAGIQNVSAVNISYITDSETRTEVGQTGSIGFSQTAIYDFGGSSWSVGLAADVGYSAFDKDKNTMIPQDPKKDGTPVPDKALGDSQSDYQIALYPFAEVNISEKLNLRTVFRPFSFNHKRSQAFGDIARNPYTQSVGIGISVTRDIYLYPNIQFAPLNLSADRTNVGLSLNLNI
jgi:hypothetical protein